MSLAGNHPSQPAVRVSSVEGMFEQILQAMEKSVCSTLMLDCALNDARL